MGRLREHGPTDLIVALSDTIRCLTTFGVFFGGLPCIARRAAGLARAKARALVLSHAACARRLGGIALTVEGAELVPERRPFVLVYNEDSPVKDLANLEVFARFEIDKAVMAAEYGAIPCFAAAAPAWGVVLLRRGHFESVERTLASLVAALRGGERVAMAPQGRIATDGAVCHFKRGAFLVAIRAGVPVVPMGVRGGADILRPGSVRMRPGVMSYRIGPPISTADCSERQAAALAERAHDEVLRLVEEAGDHRAPSTTLR